MHTGGLTAYAFDAAQLGVFAKPLGPGQFMPVGPGEVLAASGALAAPDGPEFGVCDVHNHGYPSYQCGYPQERVYDAGRGVAADGERSNSGITVSVIGGQVQVTRGAQTIPGAKVSVQLYPSLLENGDIVTSNSGSNADAVGRAALAVISPTRLAFVVANAMPMVEFARSIRDNLGASYAGYTDGGGSTALVTPGQTYLGSTGERRRVPTWLVVNGSSGANWLLVGAVAVVVFAVHDAGLVRMNFQTDLRHPLSDGPQHLLCLGLGCAVKNRVIRVALETDEGKLPRQPCIERVVEEEVRQQG
jgi:hypothetical protein